MAAAAEIEMQAAPGVDSDEEVTTDGVRLLTERSTIAACGSWWSRQSNCRRFAFAAALLIAGGAVAVIVAVPGLDRPADAPIDGGSGSGPADNSGSAPSHDRPAPHGGNRLVLVSLDGFRWDYADAFPDDVPTLQSFARHGVKAKAMRPAFPSKTFPNHYTLVTGLYPESHGIVLNKFYDPEFDATFTLRNGSPREGRWWGGEPLWVTAVKAGVRSGCVFWPGSEAEIAGHRPTYYLQYDGNMPYRARVEQLIQWAALPDAEAPSVFTLYMEAVDTAGHRFGPLTPEVRQAMQAVDDALAYLLQLLEENGMADTTDIVVVSDHGMTEMSASRVLFLDDYIAMSDVTVIDTSPILSIVPNPPLTAESLVDTLKDVSPHLQVFLKQDGPPDWHYQNNRRITEVVGVLELGWELQERRSDFTGHLWGLGSHGFNNSQTDMGASFFARGPSFREGFAPLEFDNLHIYELCCLLLGLDPAPNNGTLGAISHVLKSDVLMQLVRDRDAAA